MIIDVIIPAYNCRNELIRCLHSTASQTYAKDIDVTIVDDASDDELLSEHELGECKTWFHNIKYIRLPENGGPGHARATGQTTACGKYLTFIDADDTWATSYSIEKLVTVMESNRNIDACFGKFIEETRNEKMYWVEHDNDRVWMFGKMYRREFLEENNIVMNDSRSNEDMGFNQLVLACTDNVVWISDPIYYWHYKENSITRRPENDYSFIGLKGYIYNHKWAFLECEKRGLNNTPKRHQSIISAMCMMYLYHIESIETRTPEKNKELESWIQDFVNTCIGPYVERYDFNKQLIISILRDTDLYRNYLPSITFEQWLKTLYNNYTQTLPDNTSNESINIVDNNNDDKINPYVSGNVTPDDNNESIHDVLNVSNNE